MRRDCATMRGLVTRHVRKETHAVLKKRLNTLNDGGKHGVVSPCVATLGQCSCTIGQDVGKRFNISTKRASIIHTLAPSLQIIRTRQGVYSSIDGKYKHTKNQVDISRRSKVIPFFSLTYTTTTTTTTTTTPTP